MSDLHSAARGFVTAAATYGRGRPDYPDELRRWLAEDLGLAAGRVAVDLGAGTGKFTPLLTRTGATVIAVEPVDAMRAKLAEAQPEVRALAGTAQAMPLAAASADAVVCAQAFHWFDSRESLAEIHRVLKPGGRLGLVWNVRDESVDWVAELTRIIAPYEGDAPRFHTGRWRAAFDGPDGGRYFSAPTMTAWTHHHTGSADDVIVNRILSVSFIAALPAADRARVEARVRELIAAHPALRGRPAVSFPSRTDAYLARRIDAQRSPARAEK
jgi:SAM-dependent methyltransferase